MYNSYILETPPGLLDAPELIRSGTSRLPGEAAGVSLSLFGVGGHPVSCRWPRGLSPLGALPGTSMQALVESSCKTPAGVRVVLER